MPRKTLWFSTQAGHPCPQRGRMTATATLPASCPLTLGPGPNQTCPGSPQGPWCPHLPPAHPAKGTRTHPVAVPLWPVRDQCGHGPRSLPRPGLVEVGSAIAWASCRSTSDLHGTCGPQGDRSVKICDPYPAHTWLARSQPGRPAPGGASRSQGTHGGLHSLGKTPRAAPHGTGWVVALALLHRREAQVPERGQGPVGAPADECTPTPPQAQRAALSLPAAETPAARWPGAPGAGPPRHEGGQSAEACGPQAGHTRGFHAGLSQRAPFLKDS